VWSGDYGRLSEEAFLLAEVGRGVFDLGQHIVYDPYTINCATGAFIVTRVKHHTVGARMICGRVGR